MPHKELSAMTQYLVERTSGFWTRTNILMLAIVLEHVIIALKVVIALVIPDVPARVKQSERRRADFILQATSEMRAKKKKKAALDLDDLVNGVGPVEKLLEAPDKSNAEDGVAYNRKTKNAVNSLDLSAEAPPKKPMSQKMALQLAE